MPGPFTITAAQLIANDTGTNLKIVSVAQPPNGGGSVSLDVNAQTITYTIPAKLGSGLYPNTDSFGYTVQNYQGTRANATVHINLTNCPVVPPTEIITPPASIKANDDFITVTAVRAKTVQFYRSSIKLNPYTYMTYDLGYATDSIITFCGAQITIGQYDGLNDFANKVNAALGPQGFVMYNTDDQGNRLDEFNSQDGYVVIARSDPYFSQSDVASLPGSIWGTPTFGVSDQTPRLDIVYPASVFLTNDQINGTTKITSITQPTFLSASLDVQAQTITIPQPNKFGNGNGTYGNITKDQFTYTINDVVGNRDTATVYVTVDNGVADPAPNANCGAGVVFTRMFDRSSAIMDRVTPNEMTWEAGQVALAFVMFTMLENNAGIEKSWAGGSGWTESSYVTQSFDRSSVVYTQVITQALADQYNAQGLQLCVPYGQSGDLGIGGRIVVVNPHRKNATIAATGGYLDMTTGHSGMQIPLNGPLISINVLFAQPGDAAQLPYTDTSEFTLQPQFVKAAYEGQDITASGMSITVLTSKDKNAADGPEFSLFNTFNGYFMQATIAYTECPTGIQVG